MAEKFILEVEGAQYFMPEIGSWITGKIMISKEFLYLSYADEWIPVILKEITDADLLDNGTIMLVVKTMEKEYSLYIKHNEKELKKIFSVIRRRKSKASPFTPLYRTTFIIIISALAIYLVSNILVPELDRLFNPVLPERNYINFEGKSDEFIFTIFENYSLDFSTPVARREFGCLKYQYDGFEIYSCANNTEAVSIYLNWTSFWSNEDDSRENIMCSTDVLCRGIDYLRCAEASEGNFINRYFWSVAEFSFYSENEEGINAFQEIYCTKI